MNILGFWTMRKNGSAVSSTPGKTGEGDYRGVSFYGQELCDGHFCPSYYYISQNEKQALLHILDDWYLYGLVITDIDLVKGLFQMDQRRNL